MIPWHCSLSEMNGEVCALSRIKMNVLRAGLNSATDSAMVWFGVRWAGFATLRDKPQADGDWPFMTPEIYRAWEWEKPGVAA